MQTQARICISIPSTTWNWIPYSIPGILARVSHPMLYFIILYTQQKIHYTRFTIKCDVKLPKPLHVNQLTIIPKHESLPLICRLLPYQQRRAAKPVAMTSVNEQQNCMNNKCIFSRVCVDSGCVQLCNERVYCCTSSIGPVIASCMVVLVLGFLGV